MKMNTNFARSTYITLIQTEIMYALSNSYPLEVVGAGSETQLQVGKNVYLIMH